jgi:hypothetical protein
MHLILEASSLKSTSSVDTRSAPRCMTNHDIGDKNTDSEESASIVCSSEGRSYRDLLYSKLGHKFYIRSTLLL